MEKVLRVNQAQRDAAEKEAQIIVQENEAARREKELQATVIKIAEAQREQRIIQAQAEKQALIIQAEAVRESEITKAQGSKQSQTLEGEGQAAKTKAVLVAEAEGQAAKTRQALLAEAEGQAAMKGLVLKAEAEGTKQLAEALARMTADAKLILVLDRMPALMDKGGDALSKVMSAIFSSVAAPFGNIDEVRIIDVGGSGRGLNQFGSIVPNTVFQVLTSLQAQGIDVSKLLAKLGVNIEEVLENLGQKTESADESKNAVKVARKTEKEE
jgi:flotillin